MDPNMNYQGEAEKYTAMIYESTLNVAKCDSLKVGDGERATHGDHLKCCMKLCNEQNGCAALNYFEKDATFCTKYKGEYNDIEDPEENPFHEDLTSRKTIMADMVKRT